MKRIKERRLGESVAVIHARMSLRGQTAPNGAKAGLRQTIFQFVTENRGDDGWAVVSAHNVEVVPGTETHAASGREEGRLLPQHLRSRKAPFLRAFRVRGARARRKA